MKAKLVPVLAPLGVVLPLGALLSLAETPYEPVRKEKLDQLPQPWKQEVHRLSLPEYEATLKYWAQQHSGIFSFQKRGESHDRKPIHLLKITDASVPDDDKQVAMVTCLHGGPERSGASTAMHLVEWLMGDSDLAKETRRKQIVLVVPIANPYAYFVTDRFGNKERIEVYDPELKWWDLKTLTLTEPEKTPEIAAMIGIVDEYKPEVHMDLHGVGLQGLPVEELGNRKLKEGFTMFEVSACSYSNCGVRPWDPRVTEAMVRAGQEAGFGSDRAEADGQRCFWNADHDELKNQLWIPPRPGRFRTPFYGYMKYHTMISTTEIGWEQSGVARVSGILALGNKPWVDEKKISGYPVSRLRWRAGRFVTCYGQTASERRKSRVEIWQAQGEFADGILYPECEGRASYICGITPKGKAALDENLPKFIENLKQMPEMKAAAIEHFLSLGPEHRQTANKRISSVGAPLQHGLGIRLRVPYRNPTIVDVAVNGRSLKESETDGYEAWYADGYTQVQVNIPPSKTKVADLFVVTCAYNPNEKRTYGWKPPEAVMQQLEAR